MRFKDGEDEKESVDLVVWLCKKKREQLGTRRQTESSKQVQIINLEGELMGKKEKLSERRIDDNRAIIDSSCKAVMGKEVRSTCEKIR